MTTNRTFSFVQRNIPRVVALMVMLGHVKSRVNNYSSTFCLLKNPSLNNTGFVTINDNIKHEQGVYLFYDNSQESWVRSGVAYGQGITFSTKHDTYRECSKSVKETDSAFHKMYRNTRSLATNGCFDDLEYYCAFSFNKNNTNKITASGNTVFEWRQEDMQYIWKRNFAESRTIEGKQLFYISHLVELCYRLMIGCSSKHELFPKQTILDL